MVHRVILHMLNVQVVHLAMPPSHLLVALFLGHVLVQVEVLQAQHVQPVKLHPLFVLYLGEEQYLVVHQSQLIKLHQLFIPLPVLLKQELVQMDHLVVHIQIKVVQQTQPQPLFLPLHFLLHMELAQL